MGVKGSPDALGELPDRPACTQTERRESRPNGHGVHSALDIFRVMTQPYGARLAIFGNPEERKAPRFQRRRHLYGGRCGERVGRRNRRVLTRG